MRDIMSQQKVWEKIGMLEGLPEKKKVFLSVILTEITKKENLDKLKDMHLEYLIPSCRVVVEKTNVQFTSELFMKKFNLWIKKNLKHYRSADGQELVRDFAKYFIQYLERF